MVMTSSRPYLLRALYEWILDNNTTPYVLVNAMADQVDVPQQFVKNGQIVLNIAPAAVVGLQIENESMHFNGRFGGVPTDVFVPVAAVMGIYAKENGQGMFFEAEETPPPADPGPKKAPAKPTRINPKPNLKIIK